MTAHAEIILSVVDRIKQSLVGLKMPRAIEILDATVRRIERGEMNALEAIDALLAEELALRENRRIKMALVMARLSAIKTLAGFDFSFQPSLDKNRVMALAELRFIDRAEVLHLIGPPGDPVVATALLDRVLHHATVIQIEGASYRLREHADLVPENIRSKGLIQPTPIPPTLKRRGRPKSGGLDHNDG